MDPRLRGGDTEDRSLRLGPRLRPAALFGGLGRGAGDLERQFVVLQMDAHLAAMDQLRSEEHTSELQSLMRISYAVFCLKKKKKKIHSLTIQQYNQHDK